MKYLIRYYHGSLVVDHEPEDLIQFVKEYTGKTIYYATIEEYVKPKDKITVDILGQDRELMYVRATNLRTGVTIKAWIRSNSDLDRLNWEVGYDDPDLDKIMVV